MSEQGKEPKEAEDNSLGTALALGLCFGLVFGLLIDNLGLGLAFGPLLGIAYHGAMKNKQSR